MKRQWEKCPRDETPARWAAPYVTMNRLGEIVLTRITYEIMGEPESFTLLFDRISNTIGLDPASSKTPDAFPAGPRGSYGGRVVRAYRLCQKFGIRLDNLVR